MSLLSLCQALAKNVGYPEPASIVGSADRGHVEMLQFANEAGEELARRVDWGQLNATTSLAGDGTNLAHSLPNDFARLVQGVCVTQGASIVRPLTQAEWASLTPTVGQARYFLLEGARLTLWPFLPSATALTADNDTVTVDSNTITADGFQPEATATVIYQSQNWTNSGASYMADDDVALIDEDLLLKGLIVRYRRQKGMDYADQEAEYEAALTDLATFNDRSRL